MQKSESYCSDKYTLTEAGWMNVTTADTEEFCKPGGCGEHTMAVLTCIHLVKRDYKFANKATVQDLNFTITQGCDSGFNETTIINDARRTGKSGIEFIISILVALFLLMHFHD
ncbi:uncharacterized protein LOC110426358 [Herrania umbratica]|uniref:Uncharacterized protein LOC110426358 n=1 Tax=Herrania umbratica TaxID=108875 RepID=A0A6J1BCM4_9ROSI|nr:uncharacterized protein LOC110426358 [Herrania umbratica]